MNVLGESQISRRIYFPGCHAPSVFLPKLFILNNYRSTSRPQIVKLIKKLVERSRVTSYITEEQWQNQEIDIGIVP